MLTRRTRVIHSLVAPRDASPIQSKKGVGAIFSSSDLQNSHREFASHIRRISRRLLADIVELSLLLIFYSAFVQDYSSNLILRSWVHSTLPWAEFLLNFYAVLTVAVLVGFLAVYLIDNQRQESSRI